MMHALDQNIGQVSGPPLGDQTPQDFPAGFFPSRLQAAKRAFGGLIYPVKNRVERGRVGRFLHGIGIDELPAPRPNVICFGHKGFGIEIFLTQIARAIGRPRSVLCFGCGLGYETLLIARFLRPQAILGIDFFNYARAWSFMKAKIELSCKAKVEFAQIDLRSAKAVDSLPKFDMVISNAVLEHLQDMDDNFISLKQLLNPQGYFASQWGPMWYSYSGDHIAAELGFDAGFEHVRLSPEEYMEFYKSHPRNRDTVARGEPTWLELGLHNYRRYDEYIGAIQTSFGPIRWLKWQLSPEAFRWRDGRQEDWNQMLKLNADLSALDFVLNGAAVIASPQ
jgi:SAM-dependent methyltransferase